MALDLVRPQVIAPNRYTVWGTMNVAAAFAENPPEAVVYLSSTSVYGRRSGEWTDETTPVDLRTVVSKVLIPRPGDAVHATQERYLGGIFGNRRR